MQGVYGASALLVHACERSWPLLHAVCIKIHTNMPTSVEKILHKITWRKDQISPSPCLHIYQPKPENENRSATCWGKSWLRLLDAVASPAIGARAALDFQQFHYSSLWTKSDSQLSKCCAVCEIS